MKANVLFLLFTQHKVAAVSAVTLLATVSGGAIYTNAPVVRDTVASFLNPQTQTTSETATIEATAEIVDSETAPTVTINENMIATDNAQNIETSPEATETIPVEETNPTEATVQETTSEPTTVATQAPKETAATTTAETTTAATTTPPETAVLGDTSGTYQPQMASDVLTYVNQQRSNAGLAALTWNDTLTDSANIRVTEAVVSWSHTRPDGSSWWTAGAQMQLGENLAYGQNSAEQVVTEWMASPGHAANILGNYTMIGISCYYCNGTYYWAQHFA